MGQYFGTDGIRGVANTELTPEFTLGLGRAVVRTLREEGVARPQITIGRDPRATGHMLEAALAAGICSAGGDAVLLGVLPTPGVAYLTPHLGADSGAVISASHNPVGDNGIKFFGPTGYKLTDAEEGRVEELLQLSHEDRPEGSAIGRIRDASESVAAYVDHLVAAADADCGGLKVVVDCAHGAASTIAPAVLERLGCDLVTICAEPDGTNINADCGSTHPERIAAAVVQHGAAVGLAHDGDADRLIAADADGNIVDGDQILAILAQREQAQRGLDAVVTTVMTNLGFTKAMEQRGIEVIQTKVGDRYVLEAMLAGGHPLGGEQSGHLILARHATTGDGVLSAVALLSAVAVAGRPLAELAGIMTRLPQVLVNVRGVDRNGLDDAERLWAAVREAEASLDGAGRVLVRASGTEPVVRVMVEAETEALATEVAERLAGVAADELALDR
jgi:phosphoglucosamine mutase